MAMSAAFHPPAALRASTILSVLLAVLVADAEGRHHVHECPPFSCGRLRDVSSPFRRRGDPPGCGVPSYELVCTDAKATIRVGSATYDVVSINYTRSTFWVVEANLGMQSRCPLPRWDHHALEYNFFTRSHRSIELAPLPSGMWATFVNCSQPIENNVMYKPVACLSTNSSFIYVLMDFSSPSAGNFQPSCGYLAMTPIPENASYAVAMKMETASYADVVKFMGEGFALRFPYKELGIRQCLQEVTSEFREATDITIKDRVLTVLMIDFDFWSCVVEQLRLPNNGGMVLLHWCSVVRQQRFLLPCGF